MSTKVCWGILGAGNIANRFAASLAHDSGAQLVAVSCRTQPKAQAFADKYGAARAYGDYNALLADAGVDAIYLALPHGLHRPWAVQALAAGKAVLCEKPAGLCADDVRAMADAAHQHGTLFMEAMKTRFVPLYAQLRALVASGALGELLAVETSLCNNTGFAAHGPLGQTYHTQPGQGGVLLDCGTYCACWLDDYLPGEIACQQADIVIDSGIDWYVNAALRAGPPATPVRATLECAFDRAKPRTAVLRGTRGTLVVEELHRPQTAHLYQNGAPVQTLHAPYEVDDFYSQIRHFEDCLRRGLVESPMMPHAASLRCAQILDCIRDFTP